MTLNEYVKSKESELTLISEKRYYDETYTFERRDKNRNEANRDYARVLYSSSFRRLQGKMQLLVPKSLNFYRNRLTHSLEVAQIAKSIACRLGMEDIQTVQTCSLAHDIGNPPFGHAGERYLSNLSVNHQFEGNAQTFRVLNHLEEKHYEYNGLNLTYRTLLGVVKYPNNYSQNSRKFLYDEDYEMITKISRSYNVSLCTIDCEVMDLADEIAYAAHDLEDSLKLKYFTLDDLIFEFEKSDYKEASSTLKEIINSAKKLASGSHTYKTSEEFSILLKKEITSQIVDLLVSDIGLVTDFGNLKLGYQKHKLLAKGLKKLTFKAINRSRDIIEYEYLGKKVLRGLYNVYTDQDFNHDLTLLPADFRDIDNRERTILDFIGGMQDEYAIEQYRRYYGSNPFEGLYKLS